jgi:excisionase family DNA binding protein
MEIHRAASSDSLAGTPLPAVAERADPTVELLRQMLDEQRAQTALLRRIWLGDTAQLSRADIAEVLGVSTSRVDEMIADGLIPTYRLPGRGARGHQRVGWDTLRAVIRSWAR